MTRAIRRESDTLRMNVIRNIQSPGNTPETDAHRGRSTGRAGACPQLGKYRRGPSLSLTLGCTHVAKPAIGQSEGRFKCDGRIYCSQMTSCAEATFFLQTCPGTKMDGNNDGIPCERQWCK